LEIEFPPEEAEKQLAIAIDWGRYAEVIAYDHSAGMIYLEAAAARK
jgi:NitT/TauT family transport system ATP-binding protein